MEQGVRLPLSVNGIELANEVGSPDEWKARGQPLAQLAACYAENAVLRWTLGMADMGFIPSYFPPA